MDQILAIRTFVRVAEAGSFAKAADTLNLPRSSVSKLVQDLEAHLGTKLVERTTRTVTVTTEGAAYHERALRLLADLDDMDGTVAGSRSTPKGRLRVDVGSVLANHIIIPSLSDFQRQYPDIDLMLGVSDRSADLIGEGIDCVIRGGSLADSSLKARKLCELDYILCAAPTYLEGRELPTRPDEIEAHRVVSYFSASSGKRFPLRFLRGNERTEYVPTSNGISVNESTAHLNSLVAGLGIGQSFGFLAKPHIERGALVELLPRWKPENHSLHLVYPGDRFPNPRLRAFADWVTGVFERVDARRSSATETIHPDG
ncbi:MULTISPECIES: LysR family transcriptional regulator [Ensifer]|uniref:LysR family transcriptional regulator n=1 Tax=Ensifer TaxID=106591 RepID=UPI0007620348|nr:MULTISPECIES: LysR family transcriptional regulator [Ensifer]MBD9524577.1 LysR family transcriptional regulator [Ensifer sp. ENS02]MBD9560191.1 LysR family transcriptional regulator [Ensifer sp. ENS03]UTV41138.1 LysR family transcriptional regulator [Ensifer adhaerens]